MKNTNLHTPRLVAAVVVAVVLFCAANASAQVALSIGGKDQAVTDESYDYLSDNNFLSGGHLTAGFEVIDGVSVGLEYDWASEKHDPFDFIDNELELDGLFAQSRIHHPVLPFFRPYVTLGFGVYYAELRSQLRGAEREEQKWLPAAHGLGGVELTVPPVWMRAVFGTPKSSIFANFTVGLRIEAGYEWVAEGEFNDLQKPEPDKEPDPEDRPIDNAGISFGTVSLSGPLLRVGLVARY